MSLLISLLPGNYKGVPFFVIKESIARLGQKRIKHEYPNTNTQYLEPQGVVPGEFTIELFFSGPAYQAQYKGFQSVLEDASPGRLFLPTFGIFENVVAVPPRAESVHTEIGKISMVVTFNVTIDRPSPTEAQATKENVSDAASNSRNAAKGAIIGL